MRRVEEWIAETVGLSPEAQGKLLATAATILILWAARVLLLRFIQSWEHSTAKTSYRWSKGSAYVIYGLMFLMVGRIWSESFASLATVVGLISAGVAVALKEPLMNFAGWLFILWRKPFELGDRVEVGEFRGDVVDQGVFTFSLMEVGNWVNADDRTGRLLLAPNGVVFTKMVANYSKGWFEHIWDELTLTVTFESNWRAAKQLLCEIAEGRKDQLIAEVQASMRAQVRQYMMLPTSLEPRVFVGVVPNGVALTLRYLCSPFERRSTAEQIWEQVLVAVHDHADIDFAYPTVRYFDNLHEGKPDARAPRPE
ncbi:MAG: mechanosensitive ion channel family protein [Enhygromyxa sp.]